ncbi:hypothetical protein [Modestobacter sp. Leaf380]|uniref:hypothetical protein n=1 Tax=Modestobacter sp. Leaf380 TaxID=1736356 RepID=UPI0006F33D33|nr:hypothetical protein [Modestobacter sp. Leaf380]KQS64316.1 hypothetical protein ASG41_16855 [Modestobacter sp. Leaf380]
MATSLGQLLDSLVATAEAVAPTPGTRADAALALGQLGRALQQLRQDGVSKAIGAQQERQVGALGLACTEVSRRAPANEGTMGTLAAAAADTLAALYDHSTVSARWAMATAVTDAVTPVARLVGGGLPAGPTSQWLDEVYRQSVLVQQTAALNPPSRAGAAILDRPLPGPTVPGSTDPRDVVPETVAVLLRATGSSRNTPSVAEVLAYTLAAETLSSAVQRLDGTAAPEGGQLAAPGWRAVRSALRPYDDGTRRPHPHAPPAVDAALRLHGALSHPDAESSPGLHGVLAAAAQHLPTLASQLLYRTVRSWADSGTLLAYARDLPPRDDRVAAFLRGYQPSGLVRVNAVDLQPVAGAIHNARLLSLDVAARVAPADMDADFPRRSLAANQASLGRPDAASALQAARIEAGRQLLLGRDSQPGRTWGR